MGVTFLWPKATGGDDQWHLIFWNSVVDVKWKQTEPVKKARERGEE
jgi:hypothetical protein